MFDLIGLRSRQYAPQPPPTRGPRRDPDGALQPGLLPDFLIIGGMKCGTTSLYAWLSRHPSVAPTDPKEIHFFDDEHNFGELGIDWYRAHFPRPQWRRRWITGEATPGYLFFPEVAGRAARVVPNAALIVLVRDPVARVESHWNHQRSRGREHDDLSEAVQRTLRSDADGADARRNGDRAAIRTDTYLRRGRYAEQLERWWRHYPRERTLVMDSARLFGDPDGALAQVYDFLGLPEPESSEGLSRFTVHNKGEYNGGRMTEDTHRLLSEYYAPYNRRLYDLLGTDFGWP